MNTDLDIATRALGDLEFRLSDEFGSWFSDEGHRELFEELLAVRESVMNIDGNYPHASMEATLGRIMDHESKSSVRLSGRKRGWKNARRMAVAATVAAVVALGGVWAWLQRPQTADVEAEVSPVMVIPASSEVQQVTLTCHKAQADVKPSTHTLTTPRGQTFKLEMEDGTIVWLNADSRLTYPNHFASNERQVTLEGEAYFKVAKDSQRPFIVHTAEVTTRVLGTEFNIRAYRERPTHVTLLQGKVRVSDNRMSQTIDLSPGQDATADSVSANMEVSDVDVMEQTAWKDQLFCFRNEELTDIMREIGRWYNVEIVFMNERSMHYHFNFWADKKAPLPNTLHLLNAFGKVEATIKDGRVIVK